jgi:hypothetical protein
VFRDRERSAAPRRATPAGVHSEQAPEEAAAGEHAEAERGGERLQKVLAAAGVASRRECEELITEGRVDVDGVTVTELGAKVDRSRQVIKVDGEPLPSPKLVYYAVNKPTGVVTTARDPSGRPRVIDLLPPSVGRVFPVGRLDMESEGLILLTNDGELANRLTHPQYGVEKTYEVQVAGLMDADVLSQLSGAPTCLKASPGRCMPGSSRSSRSRRCSRWCSTKGATAKCGGCLLAWGIRCSGSRASQSGRFDSATCPAARTVGSRKKKSASSARRLLRAGRSRKPTRPVPVRPAVVRRARSHSAKALSAVSRPTARSHPSVRSRRSARRWAPGGPRSLAKSFNERLWATTRLLAAPDRNGLPGAGSLSALAALQGSLSEQVGPLESPASVVRVVLARGAEGLAESRAGKVERSIAQAGRPRDRAAVAQVAEEPAAGSPSSALRRALRPSARSQ